MKKVIEDKKIIEEKDFSLFRITYQGEAQCKYRLEDKDEVALCIYDINANLIVVEKRRPIFEDSYFTVPIIKIEEGELPKNAAERLLRSFNISFEKGALFNTAIFIKNPEVSNAKTYYVLYTVGDNERVLNEIFSKELPEDYISVKNVSLNKDSEFTPTNVNAIIKAHITALQNVIKEEELAKTAEELNKTLKDVGDKALDTWETTISQKLRNGEEVNPLQIGKNAIKETSLVEGEKK